MDKITLVKKEVKAAEWAEKIEACRSSGKTVEQWCSENGINIKTYYYHLRMLREKVCDQIPIPIGQVSNRSKAAVTVHSGELSVEIADGTSAETIEAIMRALRCY